MGVEKLARQFALSAGALEGPLVLEEALALPKAPTDHPQLQDVSAGYHIVSFAVLVGLAIAVQRTHSVRSFRWLWVGWQTLWRSQC
jgi:hypothetical protein